jgi:radical S-adenosyl methionine domain-containing protein 2
MRVLKIVGENDRTYDRLTIDDEQFASFLLLNSAVPEGVIRIAEDNDDMVGSYVMVDPAGRFISNTSGRYVASPAILEVGVQAAYTSIDHYPDVFVRRGGQYDW